MTADRSPNVVDFRTAVPYRALARESAHSMVNLDVN
jgi:hypothetical protein